MAKTLRWLATNSRVPSGFLESQVYGDGNMIKTKLIESLAKRYVVDPRSMAEVRAKDQWEPTNLYAMVRRRHLPAAMLFDLIEQSHLLSENQWFDINCQWVVWQRDCRDKTNLKRSKTLDYASRLIRELQAGHKIERQDIENLITDIWMYRLLKDPTEAKREVLSLAMLALDNPKY